MTTATTPKTVNLAERPVVQNEYKAIPSGTYEFELGEPTIKNPGGDSPFRDDGSLKTQYVNVSIKVFGGTIKPEGRNATASLFLGEKEGANGKRVYQQEGGLIALLRSLGASLPEISVISTEAVNPAGETVTAELLNPAEVVETLTALRGSRGKVYIKAKTESYKGKTQEKNEFKFLAATSEA